MSGLRFVIIGAGAGVLNMHRPALDAHNIAVVAVQDRNRERGIAVAAELGAEFFDDHKAMLSQVEADVALILTSHPSHAEIAVDCFAASYHVLVEKPMAVQIRDADRMIHAAQRAGRKLGVCFQRRYMPSVIAAKHLIEHGRLGDIQYVHMSASWTRPHVYFKDRPWRGTWSGEGGGVLINQGVHNLDTLCYLLGLPRVVKAWVRTQLQPIETEDTAHVMLQWDNGAYGSFHASTAEAGPPTRFEIRGTHGYLVFTDYALEHIALESDVRDHLRESTDPYGEPGQHIEAVSLAGPVGDHVALYHDFTRAILSDSQPGVDGQSSRMPLELANAILYSAHSGQEVTLPLDADVYSDFLAGKQHPKNA